MAYFSNGTEGAQYEARYCEHCIHRHAAPMDADDGGVSCPIWTMHFAHNGEEQFQNLLNMLIPMRPDGLAAEQCTMFVRGEPAVAPPANVLPAMRQWKEQNL